MFGVVFGVVFDWVIARGHVVEGGLVKLHVLFASFRTLEQLSRLNLSVPSWNFKDAIWHSRV